MQSILKHWMFQCVIFLSVFIFIPTLANSNSYNSNFIKIKTIDFETFEIVPSRIVIERLSQARRGHSRYYGCEKSFLKYNQENLNEYFYSSGDCYANLPVGLYKVSVMRGMEFYMPIPIMLRVTEDDVYMANDDEYKRQRDWRKAFKKLKRDKKEITFKLERWIDMKSLGFWSGDSHIHARYNGDKIRFSEEELLDIIIAEDLNVANMIIANDLGTLVYDIEMFTGDEHNLSTNENIMVWNQELRNNHLGHIITHNLSNLVGPLYSGFFGYPDNFYNVPDADLAQWDVPNADWAEKIKSQNENTMVVYAHPVINLGFEGHDDFAKISYDLIPDMMELPVDVALGLVDGIEIFSYPATNSDSIKFWYRLLNTGYNLHAAAGTDSFLGSRVGPYFLINPLFSLPPGGLRQYVFIPDEEEFSYENWVRFAKAGQTFVTNGPMFTNFEVMYLQNNDSEFIGGELRVNTSTKQEFIVNFTVHSQFPIGEWAIIVNGESVARRFVNSKQLTVSEAIYLDKSSWVAIEIKGDKPNWIFDGDLHAHTSPIYITINNELRHSPNDATYFVRRINRDLHYIADRGYFKPNSDQRIRLLKLFEQGCKQFEAQQIEARCESFY